MKNKIVTYILIIAFLISMASVSLVIAQDHHDHDEITTSQCDTPTEHIVSPSVHEPDGKLSFGGDKQVVTKGACVMVHFINPHDTLHDLTIDEDASISFEGVHLSLKNSTDGLNGTNQNIVNIQMPDADVTLKFYCSVSGHETAGMVGKIVVGEGSPEAAASGFEFFPLILVFIVSIVLVNKKK